MAAGDIFRETDKGAAQINDRRTKLQPAAAHDADPHRGTRPDFLDQLAALGLIEKAGGGAVSAGPQALPTGGEFSRLRAAKDFMNMTIVDALGIKSFFFTMKLERAGTRADLRELAPAYREALGKVVGESQAEVLAHRLEARLR